MWGTKAALQSFPLNQISKLAAAEQMSFPIEVACLYVKFACTSCLTCHDRRLHAKTTCAVSPLEGTQFKKMEKLVPNPI